MKILQIHNSYQTPGGEDEVVVAEKELLETKGHRVVQYTRHNNELKKYSPLQKLKFFPNAIYSKRTIIELDRLIGESKPDVSHIHNVFPLISPSVYHCLSHHNIPIVQTLHNYRFLCPNALFYTKKTTCEKCKKGNTLNCLLNKCYKDSFILSGLYALTIRLHRKAFMEKINKFIALTDFVKTKFVQAGFREEKIEVEGNFLVDNRYKASNDKDNYAVFIGRLSEEKGVETLLNAFQKTHGLKLKVAGNGHLEEKLKHYVHQNRIPNVEFLGFVSGRQKLELLHKAKFSIFPSQWYETFGMSILESFSVGTMVVASKIGALPELVKDGKNGLLFEPGNANDLAEKVNYLYENPDRALEMGRNARKFVQENFGAEKHYQQLMEIYRRAIGQNEIASSQAM